VGEIDTTFTVLAALEEEGETASQRDTVYTRNWEGYYFYADTIVYHPPTLDDVLAGRLTTRDSVEVNGVNYPRETLEADGRAEVPDDTRVQFAHLTHNTAILVLYQPDTRTYAYRQVALVDGLPEVSFKLYFRTWGDRKSYKENGWTVLLKREPAPEES
jgi:hypothetical protein